MIKNKLLHIIFLLILTIFISSCALKSRFVRSDILNIFTFSLAGQDPYNFCSKINPNFIKPYKNVVNPSETCINYEYYTCHIDYYCDGDKKCELEAKNYWIGNWTNQEGKPIDSIDTTKRFCKRIRTQCNPAEQNDLTCIK